MYNNNNCYYFFFFFFFISLLLFYICRGHGGISFSQLFNFVDKTYDLWEILYKFRIIMIDTFFPEKGWKRILDRRLHINEIKQYRQDHDKEFPVQNNTCIGKILTFIFDVPNPNRYDYDYIQYSSTTYSDYSKHFIRKYQPSFRNFRIHFKIKHLTHKTNNVVLNEIDEDYSRFHTHTSSRQRSGSCNESFVSTASEISYNDCNNNNAFSNTANTPKNLTQNGNNDSSKSILRTSSVLTLRHKTTMETRKKSSFATLRFRAETLNGMSSNKQETKPTDCLSPTDHYKNSIQLSNETSALKNSKNDLDENLEIFDLE